MQDENDSSGASPGRDEPQTGAQPTPDQQYQDALGNNEQVDEKKIEEEYGPPPDTSQTVEETAPSTAPHKRFKDWLTNLDRRHKLFYGVLGGIVIIAGVVSIVLLRQPGPPVVPSYPVYHAPTSTTVPSKLTGLQVDPAINKLQVTGVMIENSVFARPQSSLNQAGIVYEAIAEAGITRFMALFQDTKSEYIGPVRSARPYFVEWCQTFDCALAHVGGSPEALSDINKYRVKNLDQFAGAQYFHRISSRYAPHNMYTSQTELSKYEKQRDYKTSEFTGFEHLKTEPKIAKADITTKTIQFNYPGSAYDVRYTYDTAHNDYKRFEGGEAHMSLSKSGKQTQNTPKVVIALVMAYSRESDGYHSKYKSTGSGSMYVFQNGKAVKGTWSRDARDSQFVLKDSKGMPVQLTPGQTWISVVSQNSDVTYQ